MAIGNPLTPSRRMRAAASAELSRLQRELYRVGVREAGLATELDAVRGAREELESQVAVLRRFADAVPAQNTPEQPSSNRHLRAIATTTSSAATPSESHATVLRGARIRETAVRLLASTPQAGQAIHYRTWFELLRQQGFLPVGKDPLATFLTQLSRSPVVERSSAPGIYSLKLNYPAEARQRLQRLREELHNAGELPPLAGVDDIASHQQRRAELSGQVDAAERDLAEALRSLGDDSAARPILAG